MFRLSTANLAWLVAYLAMIIFIVAGLRNYRASAVTHFSTESATSKWQNWRAAAKEIGERGPVEREAPQSPEPPALVLMRDHFAACLGISLLLSSCLFVWFMFCVRGAMKPVELHVERDE